MIIIKWEDDIFGSIKVSRTFLWSGFGQNLTEKSVLGDGILWFSISTINHIFAIRQSFCKDAKQVKINYSDASSKYTRRISA